MAKEKAVSRSSTAGEARPSTGRRGGGKVWKILEREGAALSSCSRCGPEPRGSPGIVVGNLAPKAEKDEEVSHTQVLQANLTGRLLSLGEKERKQVDPTLEAVDMATFFKLKAWIEALHLITSKHSEERVWRSELRRSCGVVPQTAEMIFEDYIATDHSLFFLSFELESFLK